MQLTEEQSELILKICKDAGDKILEVYEREDFESVTDFKADDSPLTLADKLSHEVIDAALREHFPNIPIISEEGTETITKEERQSWEYFWLVDPLDGTKEFIKKNGEFTVNIALIHKDKPIAGYIYAPVWDAYYYSKDAKQSFKKDKNGLKEIKINNKESDRTAVRSRSHASEEEEAVLNSYKVTDTVSVGSSLKFCYVADGNADLYYRHGPTMEWDTAAGQAILLGAGGTMLDHDQPFKYNKDSLRNPGFICLGFNNL